MTPRTIKIFLADGVPQGMRFAEVGMWTGQAVVCPRAELARLAQRKEARRTGIYILAGQAENGAPGQRVYIGEGDEVWSRVQAHDADPDKEFWSSVVIFVSKDNNLTKAHVRWLEARLVKEVGRAKRVELANGNGPGGGDLPESDVADMETFLENVRLLLPVLGLDVFGVQAHGSKRPGDLELTLKWEDAAAECVVKEGQFVVRRGSTARNKEVDSLADYARDLRRKLRDNGVLATTDNPELLVFTQDYAFDSPSAAAAAVTGTGLNGRQFWKVKGSGTSYKEWQEQHASKAVIE